MNRRAATAETDTETPTHVLMWAPLGLLKDGSEACWVFLTYADARAGTEQTSLDGPCFPRDVHPHDLHSWVESRLGHPVVLSADTVSAGRHRWSLRRVTVPAYYVFPADQS